MTEERIQQLRREVESRFKMCGGGLEDEEIKECLDEIEKLQKDKKEIHERLTAAMRWIDAVPADTSLPAMPGFDRDWMEEYL